MWRDTGFAKLVVMEPATAMSVSAALALGARRHRAGRLKEAEAIYRAILKAEPAHPVANHNLGLIALAAGHSQDACLWINRAIAQEPANPAFRSSLGRALQAYLASNPADPLGAAGQLAALGIAETPARASPAHMTRLYAARADTWPHNAGYRAPELVARAISDRISQPADILDAGCGTGLVGPLLKPVAKTLVGVDLSEPMLEKARALGVYDDLVAGDLVEHLLDNPGRYDAIAAAATLIHFGDLAPVVSASSRALRPGGLFAFTLFPSDANPDGYGVDAMDAAHGGVFFHGRNYVAAQIAAAGLKLLSMTDEAHESKHHRPFMGLLVICAKPTDPM